MTLPNRLTTLRGGKAFTEPHLSANHLLGVHHSQKQGKRQSARRIKKKKKKEKKTRVVTKSDEGLVSVINFKVFYPEIGI